MAISANTIWEVRLLGSDTNGGGFVTGAAGTNYSLQNSANSTGSNISTTDAVGAGTTTITSVTAAFTTAITGNIIYLQGGTGTLAAGWYQATYVSATSITVDRAVAAGTGITMNIGGALLSPGQASANVVAGNIAFFLNIGADGTSVYSITSATGATTAGVVSTAVSCLFQGYTTTRSLGNTDARPTFQLNVSTATMWLSAADMVAQGIICDGNSQTAAKLSATTVTLIRCMFMNFNTATTSGSFVDCTATTNSAIIFVGIYAVGCEAYANTATPYSLNAIDCISSGNTGATTDGFQTPNAQSVLRNCVSVSNGRNGFLCSSGPSTTLINCHAESNTGGGFDVTVSGKALINCSAYNNTGGAFSFSTNVSNTGFIAVTAGSVFVNAVGFNFALNNIANQGAKLRAAADPSTFPRGLTSNYRDIGAAQHQDSPSTTNIFVIDD